MNSPTDSELRDRWEAVEKDLARLKGKKDPASKQELEEVKRRGDFVLLEWIEVLDKKRAGVLTDRSNMDLAIKTAKEFSVMHAIPLSFREIEGPQSEEHYAMYWELAAIYEGKKTDFDRPRFRRFATAITKELLPLGVLYRAKPDDDPDRLFGQGMMNGKGVIEWRIRTWVWWGPE